MCEQLKNADSLKDDENTLDRNELARLHEEHDKFKVYHLALNWCLIYTFIRCERDV